MKISDAQILVDNWIKQYGVRYFNELTNLGILMEEVGEFSKILVRLYGEQSVKPSENINKAMLNDELADILWVVLCLANQLNINLEEALEMNIKKKTGRDHTRHLDNQKLK
ncbi:MAG: nucleotide pyrophosphohydrolase [Alphaproteobacteria bacterium]|nr:nucleotide pyrophosphohydrolase [Alphaproteobacteria bacterium]